MAWQIGDQLRAIGFGGQTNLANNPEHHVELIPKHVKDSEGGKYFGCSEAFTHN